jgi:hypothetical protein
MGVLEMKTKHERKTQKRERQSKMKNTLMKGRSRRETKWGSEGFFSYYGFLCDRELCFGV